MTKNTIKVLIVCAMFLSLNVSAFAANEVDVFDSLKTSQPQTNVPEQDVLYELGDDGSTTEQPDTKEADTNSKHFKNTFFNWVKLQNPMPQETNTLQAEITQVKGSGDQKSKKFWQRKKKQEKEQEVAVVEDVVPENVSNINIDSDTLEYFSDRMEFEAVGHAKIIFPESNSVLEADKIVYNHDTNTIKAYDNVKLTREGMSVDGDYVQVNLNDEDNALITNPVSKMDRVEITALKGFLYSDRIETSAGTAKIKDDMIIPLRTSSIGEFWFPRMDFLSNKYKIDERYAEKYKIKTNKIIIDRKDEHDIVTMAPVHIYFKGHRILRGGNVTLVTNKTQDYVEIDGPELGSFSQIGMYLGYGKVIPLVNGSSLKISPLLNMYEGKFGVGVATRFRSARNMTDVAYTSAANRVILLGKQDITPNLAFRYGSNTYMDEWILGGRLYEYIAQLDYDKEYFLNDIDTSFRQRFSLGFMGDYEHRFSTARFRWQTQTAKSLMHYQTDDKDYMFDLALVGQTSAAVYGTGDTQLIARFGPSVRTKVKRWQQTIAYYVGGVHDGTPFYGDMYPYGRHSINILETFKLNKYLTLGYSGTLVPMKDNPMNDFIAENNFMLMVGPDEARVLLGYDTVRQRTQFSFQFLLGTKNTNVEYKKMVIKDPNKSGKKENTKKTEPTQVDL